MITVEQDRYYKFKLVRISAYKNESELVYFDDFEEAQEYADNAPPWDYVCIIEGSIKYENRT